MSGPGPKLRDSSVFFSNIYEVCASATTNSVQMNDFWDLFAIALLSRHLRINYVLQASNSLMAVARIAGLPRLLLVNIHPVG
jgi:hypothetical protein